MPRERKFAVIPATVPAAHMPATATIYIGGASDSGQPPIAGPGGQNFYGGLGPLAVTVVGNGGREVAVPSGLSWHAEVEDGPPLPPDGAIPVSTTDHRIHDYPNSTIIMKEGVRISRKDVISYIANTRGGNHWDPGGNRHDQRVLAVLSSLSNGQSASGRDPTFYALMSIAQEFTAAPDVQHLEDAIGRIARLRSDRR